MRRLVAESRAGVIENLKAIYSGLASRWLHAFEAGDDHKLSLLTGKLHVNLEMQARITKELSPGGSVRRLRIFGQRDKLKADGPKGA